MITEGIVHGTMSALTRLNVATWVDRAMVDMSAERGIVRKVWLKSRYDWFDINEGVVELVGGVEEEGLI
jgi:hypothetical protein